MGKYLPFIVLLISISACNQKEEWYSLEDFSQVKKIDVHIHIESDRPYFVEKALEDNFRLINVSLEYTDGWNDVYEKFAFGAVQRENFPGVVDMVTAFAVSDWDEEGWEDKVVTWLDSCFRQGALGVKVWKNIGMVSRDTAGSLISIDDERFDPIFRYIRDQGKVLMGHIGEPKNCWLPLDSMTTNNDRRYFERHPEYHMYLQPKMPSYDELIDARDHMLAKHPDLRFVGAHLGSLEWNVDELAKRLDRFPNMGVDLAARMGQLFYQTVDNREKVRDFFVKYQDRIMYGTDLVDDGERRREDLYRAMDENWKRDWEYFVTGNVMSSTLINDSFQGLKLPKEVVDKIYYHNGVRWFGMGE
ncbi:amidohydrolase family protein [Negadavirga shengliensis]|uniref:Amidohydrolase family protein n=1 Tax=Negadavirga shengliensis TaxID=1389218 RepID=A0ABV9T0G7_9BACT